MGIIHPEEGEFATELRKWNTPKREGGMAPDGYEAYPRMVYKAWPNASGQVACGDVGVVTGDPTAMAFASKCQLTVLNESQYDRAKKDGWSDTPTDALEAYEAKQKAIGDEAATRAYDEQRMSDRAKAEAKAADEATHEHVADVPATPVKPRAKPGPKPKAKSEGSE